MTNATATPKFQTVIAVNKAGFVVERQVINRLGYADVTSREFVPVEKGFPLHRVNGNALIVKGSR